MPISNSVRFSGLSAMLAGGLALILTFPFATAYFVAFPGYDTPPGWLPLARSAFQPVLSFNQPDAVYETYGRVFSLVYPLLLPVILQLHHLQQRTEDRWERRSFWTVIIGLALTFIGISGDYWLGDALWIMQLPGLLLLAIGSTMYGVASRRSGRLPAWVYWLLILALPLSALSMWQANHFPSGPTLPVALAWAGVGVVLTLDKFPAPGPDMAESTRPLGQEYGS
jgi:hypothetical protein